MTNDERREKYDVRGITNIMEEEKEETGKERRENEK